MQKENFQAVLCLLGGMIGAVLAQGVWFYTLHWPGGHFLLCKAVPTLVTLLLVLLGVYVLKYGVLKSYVEKGVYGAKYLLWIEGAACMFSAVLVLGFMLRMMHLAFGSWLVMFSCSALALLSAAAGFWGFVIMKKD